MTWLRLLLSTGDVHVVPEDDLRTHDSAECWCHPRIDAEENIVVHNSMDGRERHEQGAPLH